MKNIFFSSGLKIVFFLLLLAGRSYGQGSIPFTVANTSPFADTDLYVAVVGLDPSGNHVWVNARTSQVLPMDRTYNTVQGPTYDGNTGPGQNSRYAACFTKLSDIPNRTFTLPLIAGCRVFISRGQQLYLYFYGANGDPQGYAAPNPQNPVDPNRGILYEIIELTNNQFGFFGNTTRVDAFRYPMGLELFGQGYQQRTGELKTAADIVAAYKANVPAEFQSTVNNATGEISFPSKTAAFYDGTNGTTPGPQGNYFGAYLSAIWSKYQNEDLIFNAGDAGVFKGRISGGRLTVVGQSGAYAGRTGIVVRKPTTQEAFEGKGVLDNRVGDGDADLVVQAQLTAAINRHMVNTTTPNPGQQNWYDVARFYQTGPANYYARFWHLPGISIDQKSYGFAYDDVADQSASLHTPKPTKVIATFGGYAGQTPPPPPTVSGDPNLAGVYTLQNRNSGQNLDVAGASQADRARVQQYPANGCTCQQFRFEHLGNGLYKIVAQHSGKVLDVNYVSLDNGAAIVQWPYAGGANEQFYAIATGGGFYKLVAKHSGKVIEVAGSSTANLAIVQQWTDNGSNTQQWKLNPVNTAPAFSRQLEAEAASVNNGMVVEACSEGGQDMGYVDQGDYLVWNAVNFPTSGSYRIDYRVASGAGGGTISADLNGGSVPLGSTSIAGTGGWQNWTTVSRTVTINAGTYNFGIYAQTGGWNLNWVRLTKLAGATAAAATANATALDDAPTAARPDALPQPRRRPALLGRGRRPGGPIRADSQQPRPGSVARHLPRAGPGGVGAGAGLVYLAGENHRPATGYPPVLQAVGSRRARGLPNRARRAYRDLVRPLAATSQPLLLPSAKLSSNLLAANFSLD